jgi:membrane protease YdiL (CAAX protease family)
MKGKTKLYLLIAFAWTWCFWIASYLISRSQGSHLATDYTVFSLWTDAWGSDRFLPQLLFALAVYGPFIGFLVTGGFKRLRHNADGSKHFWYYIILIPLVLVIPSVVLSLAASYYDQRVLLTTLTTALFLYFISNLITSGTEEFGWRGVLYPDMKALGMSFWDIAWKGGLIWAVWHFPVVIIMYMPLGLAVLIPSLVGFTASIVAMNYITNFLYEKTHNIWFAVILHALNNTMSFLVVLLFPGTPFTILSSLMAWVIVWWIEKKYPKVIA